MTRYSFDTHGVSRARLALSHDPAELSACASAVASAGMAATVALGDDAEGLRAAIERFRVVHAHAFDALADAASALGDRLDRSTLEMRSVELFVTAGFSAVTADGSGAPRGPTRSELR
ncbi:hypothetical protein [Terrabacter carboxydivorans]|uniref:Uncharacterized protein n=1 Tax=Terrabacter carboxydivorans TaxID=619730 RepID=A0ABP5YX59_9MICO